MTAAHVLGWALIIQGVFQNTSVRLVAYAIPEVLRAGWNLGFMFLPIYRGWVVSSLS